MILTRKQEEAIKIMKTNYFKREPVTVIAGVAGSGKSTIINHFIEENNLMDRTKFVTFTGKASLVLQNKGLPATTIHKLIYNTYRNKTTGQFYFRLKPTLDDYKTRLIIVDEISMVSNHLLRDLMSFNIPIIALGDPGQLEPIGEDNGLLKKPDYFLDEIHRQAEGNSIIRLSMMIREGKPLPLISNDENVKVLTKADVTSSLLQWPDQILCGRNNTRRALNQRIRTDLGFEGEMPNVGEKVICLRNYWDELNPSDDPLINGTVGTVTRAKVPANYHASNILGEEVTIDVSTDYSPTTWRGLKIDPNIFKGFAPYSQQHPRSKREYFEFDFGYAITTHKFQGSQDDKILVFEERLGGNSSHSRWLYTAITRAKEKLVIVKM